MQNGKIPDSAITGSSYHNQDMLPRRARLNAFSSWVAGYRNEYQWLQIDLGRTLAVKKIATQGRNLTSEHYQWVTSYKISSSDDKIDWVMYQENNADKVFQGNTDRNTVVSHVLPQHIRARYVRFLPKGWHAYVAMRVELYGCSLE